MNAIAGFVADSFVYGPGYSWTIKGPNGTAVLLHDAVQARLETLVANPANAALIFTVASVLFCWVLLWLLWRKRVFLKV